MQFVLDQLENMAVSLLAIAAMGGVIFLLLLIMHWRLRAKSEAREREMLSSTWQTRTGDALKRAEEKKYLKKNHHP